MLEADCEPLPGMSNAPNWVALGCSAPFHDHAYIDRLGGTFGAD
jgi:hypothetical protein